jgi:putative transposase
MPRLARTVVVDVPHHITQRGNNRQDVFFVDDDRTVYLEILKKQSGRYGLFAGQGDRADASDVYAVHKPFSQAQRAFVAEPVLFVCP